MFEVMLMLNVESILEDVGIEGQHIKQEKAMKIWNDSENERDSEAGGKVNTVITAWIRSAGGEQRR